MTKNRTPTPVYLDPGMHSGLEVKGLMDCRAGKSKYLDQARSRFSQFPLVATSFDYRGANILSICKSRENSKTSFTKWNESGFRPPLCTYRLDWARRTSWGLWDDWDDTVLQTQDSKFEPWRSEAEHATSRSRRLPKIPPLQQDTMLFTSGTKLIDFARLAARTREKYLSHTLAFAESDN